MGITVIERVKIQAQVLVPLVKALQAELGEERANALVRKTLGDIFRRLGQQWWQSKQSEHVGDNMASAVASWARGDALDYRVRAQSQDIYEVDVTGCRYAQFYKELGEPRVDSCWPAARLLVYRRSWLRDKADAHTNYHARREPLRFSLQATGRLTSRVMIIGRHFAMR